MDDIKHIAGSAALLALPWPDIVVGAVIAALFLSSAMRMIAAALPGLRAAA